MRSSDMSMSRVSSKRTEEIVKGSFWLYLATGASLFASLLVTIILARLLDKELWGIFSSTIAVTSFLSTFYDLGLGYSVINKVSELTAKGKRGELKKVIGFLFGFKLVLTLLFAAAIFITSDLIAEWFHVGGAGTYFRISAAFFIIFNLFNFFDSMFLGLKRFRESAMFGSGHYLLRLVFSTAFVLIGFGITGALTGYILALAIMTAIQIFVLRSFLSINLKKRADIVPLLAYGFFMGISAAAAAITTWTDSIMIGFFMGATSVGIYKLAFSTTGAISTLVGTIGRVIFPIFSAAEAKAEETKADFDRVIKYGSYFTVPAAVGIAILAQPIVTVFFGPQYIESASALWILSYLVLDTVLVGAFMTYFAAKKETAAIGKATAGAAVLNVLFNLALIPAMGLAGAAIASVLTRIGAFYYLIVEGAKKGIPFNFTILTKPIVGSLVMALFITALVSPIFTSAPPVVADSIISLLLVVIAGGLFYVLFEKLIGFDILPFIMKSIAIIRA